MIKTLLGLVLRLLCYPVFIILQLVFNAFPSLNFTYFPVIFSSFFALLNNAGNLVYFLSGSMMFTWATMLITIFFAKHIALPILNFIRKVFLRI